MEDFKDEKEQKEKKKSRSWSFCEICGMVRIATSCFLVISRFADEAGNDSFVLAKQLLCLDKNGKIVVKYGKNTINFYSLRSMRETAEMLQAVAGKFENLEHNLEALL